MAIKNTPRLFTPSLRLFKALPIEEVNERHATFSQELLAATINRGFVFVPEVLDNYADEELLALVEQVASEIGISPDQMNASFHKSWTKVRDAPIFQLVIEQIMHYITTYGYESLGIYDKSSVYIPNEKLEIPDLKDGIRFAVIHGYTKPELKAKLLALLESGIALKDQTVTDVVEIGTVCGLSEKELAQIRNKEARTMLNDKLELIPQDPIEFLRLMVFKSHATTLLIISRETIEAIKKREKHLAYDFARYDSEYGLKRLAEIFLRFKSLFLAFKTEKALKTTINRIRKLADANHKPIKLDFLNSVTATLARGEGVDVSKLWGELSRVNIFRKIRLAYALNYRMSGCESILYKIRNGKSYATAFSFKNPALAEAVYSVVLESIVDSLKVKGKKIFIPSGIKYALPASEKQFTGNLPSGTSVSISKDMVMGVYWENVKGQRIDLDLSLVSIKSGKIGWDGYYRDSNRTVLFSGDQTDASNGASELFYIAQAEDNAYIMFVNYFNHNENVEVPFKILAAKESPKDFGRNYMVNPNNVVCVAKTTIKDKQKMLGLAITTPSECRFYFSETGIGKSITSGRNEYTNQAREYLVNSVQNSISLNEILELAGAVMVNETGKDVLDLSPETLEKDTIIGLLSNAV